MDLSVLNEKQREAVLSTEGPVMVVAGAGSGKTRVLTYRIAYLISELGIDKSSILAVTFTNKAAREMKDRVGQLLDITTDKMWISTFHSFGARFLRKEIGYLGRYRHDFQIIDDDDTFKLVKQICKEFGSVMDPKDAVAWISKVKNMEALPSVSDYERDELDRIYYQYNETLVEQNLLDFDDLILLTIRVLEENPLVLEKYRNLFQYIMVDEFQDTNTIQYKLVRLLGDQIRNVFIVGDQDQSIYSFRGAVVENINYFRRDFKDTKVILLEMNYRSTQRILNIANSVISRNPNRIKKNLYCNSNDGQKAILYNGDSSYGELMFVSQEIKKLVQKGYQYKDIAILYRLNSLSKGFEDEFIKAKIPYVIYGGVGFFSRKEVKDVLAYLRLSINHSDDFSLERIINVPKRKIGDTMVKKIKDCAKDNNISMFEALDYFGNANLMEFKGIIQRLSILLEQIKDPESMIDHILNITGYKQMLLDDEEEERLDNALELKSSLKDAGEYYEQGTVTDKISAFLSDVALRTDVDTINESDNCVKLMSFHQAKGLEYKVVFMVAMEEGIFPSFKAMSNPSELDEEYRICYVGVTRAREILYLTHANVRRLYGKDNCNPKSEFFRRMKEDDVEVYGHFTSRTSEESYSYKPKKTAPLSQDTKSNGKYKTGDKVMHKVFGKGVVVSVNGDKLTIAFGVEYGIKILLSNHPSFTRLEEE